MNGWPSTTVALSQPSLVHQTPKRCTRGIISTGVVGPGNEQSRLRLADAIWLIVIC